jgi:hypothetical protein
MTTAVHPRSPPAGRFATTVLGLALCQAAVVQAQGLGVASLGATGGLTIPSAYVLDSGELALSAGNYLDPKVGSFSRRQNYTLGMGLVPRVELFGRFAEYQNPRSVPANAASINGPRDLSANLKWQLPTDLLGLPGLPKLAVGATDISGGAVFFSSKYAVASDDYGPLRWSLGYARGKPPQGRASGAKVLDGVFGGAEFKLGSSRASLLAETDGTQRHAGLRYYSEVLPWLGDAQVVGTLQRSFGATNLAGRAADASSFNVSLLLPMGTADKTRQQRADAAARPLAALSPSPADAAPAAGMVATAPDRLDRLARALRATGLDRVRVGQQGSVLVVDYENQRYLNNEADALGVVLGLAAEYAPAGTARVHARSHKAGLQVLETSVEVAAYRSFLRDGDAAQANNTLGFGPLAGEGATLQWAAGEAGAARRLNWLRLELKPLLNYTLATEFGAFDYSLAANVRSTVSLWKGAEIYTDVVQRVGNSANTDPGRVFASSLHRNGVKTVALQQSFWLGPRLFTSVGAGRYEYDARGAEGESILFLPWNEDSLHLKGSYLRQPADLLPRNVEAYAGSYRWNFNTQTWLEAGYQRYTDRSTGPALTMTRWFGDVAVQLSARKGGRNTFVGLELSLPLTPRQGMAAGPVQLTGTPRYAQPIRTLLTNGGNTGNFVDNAAVRPVSLNYQSEVTLLNSGRITPEYIQSQMQRMRESFYLYAREEIK